MQDNVFYTWCILETEGNFAGGERTTFESWKKIRVELSAE